MSSSEPSTREFIGGIVCVLFLAACIIVIIAAIMCVALDQKEINRQNAANYLLGCITTVIAVGAIKVLYEK